MRWTWLQSIQSGNLPWKIIIVKTACQSHGKTTSKTFKTLYLTYWNILPTLQKMNFGIFRCKMPIYAQIVVGPAGSGKSTYCHLMQQHLQTIGRSCRSKLVNLWKKEHFDAHIRKVTREIVPIRAPLRRLQDLLPNLACVNDAYKATFEENHA